MNESTQISKSFQLDNLSIKEKSSDEWGLKMSQYIDSTIGAGISSYYWTRNNRYKLNRNSANGRINMAKFQDLLEFNGKTNYANINWQSIRIVNRIVSGLVGRWMSRDEKIVVNAIDTLSINEKQDEYKNLEFIISNKQMLEDLQEKSGVQMIPTDKDIPSDKDELDMWQTQFQRLPEEILYELGCNDVLRSNGWFGVLKEKMLHDSAEVGFVGSYTWMDEQGIIHVEWVKPENAIYSYSEYPDFRDTTWRGQVKSLKISEIRKKYGKEFGGKLTEEELWKIAGGSKDFQYNDKLRWNVDWNVTFLRPYDEWNVDVLDFEYKTVDNDSYTVVTTKKNKSTLIKKGVPDKLGDNEEVVTDTKWNIYRGVYIRTQQVLLEWGLKKNMIRPQDPKEIGNAEFSYSFYQYQSYNMINLAVPEKIEEPTDQMILARLKIQQCVAKAKPPGASINWDALQEIDYGLGDANKTINPKKHYDQTGDLYYRGRDAEGNPIPVPITELSNTGFLPQIQALIQVYQFHYQVLKDELGEDPALISQALQPRVAAGNVDTAQAVSANATDYMYTAYLECMKQTASKVACLLSKSVIFGASAYRHLLKKENVESRVFSTEFEMLPTDQEIAMLDARMNQAVASNPDLIIYLDTYKILRIAKQDVKLAEEYYRLAMKRMLESQMAQTQQNQQATIQGQIQSAQAAEQAKQQTEQLKGQIDIEKTKMESESANKTAVINMVSAILSKGLQIAPKYELLVDAVIQNLMLPIAVENEQTKAQISQAMQQEQQQSQQQEEQESPDQETQESPEQQQQQAQQGQEQQPQQQQMQSQQPTT